MLYTTATTHAATGTLIWDTDGCRLFGEDFWTDVHLTASFQYKSGNIGLFPKVVTEDYYMMVSFGNSYTYANETDATGTVSGAIADFTVHSLTGITHIDKKENLDALVVDQVYKIEAIITKNNYRILLDNKEIFNVEYSGMNTGKSALYATKDNICTASSVTSSFPNGWSTNANTLGSGIACVQKMSNEDRCIFLHNLGLEGKLWVSQTITVTESSPYTISYDYIGELKLDAIEINGGLLTSNLSPAVVTDWTKANLTFTTSAGCTQVELRFYVDTITPSKLNNVQAEPLSYPTKYIHNMSTSQAATRDRSLITYPAKNHITTKKGAIHIWIQPTIDYNTARGLKPVFVEYGTGADKIRLSHESEAVVFTYGDGSVSYPTMPLVKETWYHFIATWNEGQLGLYVNNKYTDGGSTFYNFTGTDEVIRVGHSIDSSYDVFSGAIDDLIIFASIPDVTAVNALYLAEGPMKDNKDLLLHADFNYAIGHFDTSIIEMTPAPNYGSPVIVKKEDDTLLRKVSFYDWQVGGYVNYNIEELYYNGVDDYLEVSYKGIDTNSFKIQITDEEGNLFGDPYRVEDNRIYMTLSKEDKALLKGYVLYVWYQLKDSYTVDFNVDQPDSFRVTLGSHDGSDVSVMYEGEKFFDEKLLDMIELNPLLNPNHQGFLYVTNSLQTITDFKAVATPSDLLADGVSETLVIIEPLDSSGNFVPDAKLDVFAKRGTLTAQLDPGSILLRERAGRYVYKYRAPKLELTKEGAVEVIDYIYVKDKSTGIGTQIPITLNISNNYHTEIYAKPAKHYTAEAQGTYLLNYILDYYGKPIANLPAGLGGILDMDGNGVVDIFDVKWMSDRMHTPVLEKKFTDLQNWEQANPTYKR